MEWETDFSAHRGGDPNRLTKAEIQESKENEIKLGKSELDQLPERSGGFLHRLWTDLPVWIKMVNREVKVCLRQ